MPVRYGGQSIADPVKSVPMAARVSCEEVAVLVNTILGCNVLCVTDHLAHIDKVISEARRHREEQFKITSSSLLTKLPPLACRSVQRAIDFGTSGWLTTLPLAHHHFDLSPQQFRDALCLHYHQRQFLLPATCDGCGEVFGIRK